MLTKKDRKELIDDISKVFVTKDEFKTRISNLEEKISHLPTKDEFFGRMDKLSGEIQSMREEFTAKKYRADQLEELETRVKKIEKRLNLSSTS